MLYYIYATGIGTLIRETGEFSINFKNNINWNGCLDIEQKSKGRGIMSKFEIHKCILYISMVMILLYAIHVACLGICTYTLYAKISMCTF